jgi:hypothetical protein
VKLTLYLLLLALVGEREKGRTNTAQGQDGAYGFRGGYVLFEERSGGLPTQEEAARVADGLVQRPREPRELCSEEEAEKQEHHDPDTKGQSVMWEAIHGLGEAADMLGCPERVGSNLIRLHVHTHTSFSIQVGSVEAQLRKPKKKRERKERWSQGSCIFKGWVEMLDGAPIQ